MAIAARWWVRLVAATALAGAAACGGGGKGKGDGDRYAKANDLQAACCQNLEGGARDQCLASVVKIDDRDAAKTRENQATYTCVTEHFVCDPATGHPTQPSAQAQLECIQDLEAR